MIQKLDLIIKLALRALGSFIAEHRATDKLDPATIAVTKDHGGFLGGR